MIRAAIIAASALSLAGCASQQPHPQSLPGRNEIAVLLDDWHDAASKADFNRYFGHLTESAVFIGTDATEYWNVDAFKAYAKPYFDKGKGWTYVPRDRHVYMNPAGDLAWFDEKLDNAKYGQARGSGVCVREQGQWKIAHYTLSFPVPNDVAEPVVRIIREYDAAHPAH